MPAAPTPRPALSLCIVLSLCFFLLGWTQPSPSRPLGSVDGPGNDEAAIATAARVEAEPVVDGEVLADPAYATAPVISGFRQTAPDEGIEASQRTEVRIVYTSRTLYIGVVCYDDRPDQIIVSDSRRDASLEETDSFRMLFDTYDDNQNGFVFGTNPAGIEYDAQVDNDGQGNFVRGGQGGGSIGGFNINWDGSWTVRTSITEIGWTAEFAIPFKTLRFEQTDAPQTWGLNFQRNIRRRKETSFWAPLPRQFDLNRVSLAGSLTGLEITPPRNLKLIPYALSQASRSPMLNDDTDWSSEAGADLKYSITPSLTLDLTYNTDFAQVEVDEQQVNLDRFNLFFPEKRPFFLENAGLFSVGAPGEVELFFSRRIGIGPLGEAIPILGGGRLSGKVNNSNIGLLNMQTESVDGIAAANNYTVARFQQDLPNRSAIGAMFNNRVGTGGLAPDDDYNRVFALDGKLGLGPYGQVSGFVARSQTPELDGGQYAYQLFSRYNSPGWELQLGYTEVSDDFNPELGFLSRVRGFRKIETLIFSRIRRFRFLGLQEIRPHTSYRSYWNFDGTHETGFWHIDNHWEWRNGYELHTGLNITHEGVIAPFEIYPGVIVPAGSYDHAEAQIVGWTNQGAPVSLKMRHVIGGIFGGSRYSMEWTLAARLRENFTTEVSWSRNDVDLPDGNFVTNLASTRLSYSFTPRLFLQGLFQYNDRVDLWSANFRFGWLQAANSGLFIVYNETNFDGSTALRSVILKYSRVFDLLN